MPQLNLHLTPQFERNLLRFMKARGIKTKSEAVRVAVQEGLDRALGKPGRTDYGSWVGLGLKLGPLAAKPRFKTDDDIWAGM